MFTKASTLLSIVLLSTVVLVGCGGSEAPAPVAENGATDQGTGKAVDPQPGYPLQAGVGPERVVGAFFTALKEGDDQTIAGLLSTQAWTETQRHGFTVQTTSVPSAEYVIGEVEYYTDDEQHPNGRAQVSSKLTDTDEEGLAVTQQIFWLLRQQQDGWRLTGMVAPNGTDQPYFFNFEDAEHVANLMEETQGETVVQASAEQPAAETASGQPADRR